MGDAATLQRPIPECTSFSLNVQWTPAQVVAMSTAIGDAIVSDRDEKATRKNQSVPALENYFTEGDDESWQDPNLSIQAHTNTMALRMYRWGIVCPE